MPVLICVFIPATAVLFIASCCFSGEGCFVVFRFCLFYLYSIQAEVKDSIPFRLRSKTVSSQAEVTDSIPFRLRLQTVCIQAEVTDSTLWLYY